ncbi:MAG: hypothetical protein ACI9EF_002753 [Pseudohongiellaceae bacterium]|jgi:hypothetical protein
MYVGVIVTSGGCLGLLLAPRKTAAAWRASSRGRSLFARDDLRYEDLLALTISELRELLGVPSAGLQQGRRKLHGDAAEH